MAFVVVVAPSEDQHALAMPMAQDDPSRMAVDVRCGQRGAFLKRQADLGTGAVGDLPQTRAKDDGGGRRITLCGRQEGGRNLVHAIASGPKAAAGPTSPPRAFTFARTVCTMSWADKSSPRWLEFMTRSYWCTSLGVR